MNYDEFMSAVEDERENADGVLEDYELIAQAFAGVVYSISSIQNVIVDHSDQTITLKLLIPDDSN